MLMIDDFFIDGERSCTKKVRSHFTLNSKLWITISSTNNTTLPHIPGWNQPLMQESSNLEENTLKNLVKPPASRKYRGILRLARCRSKWSSWNESLWHDRCYWRRRKSQVESITRIYLFVDTFTWIEISQLLAICLIADVGAIAHSTKWAIVLCYSGKSPKRSRYSATRYS